MLKKLEERDFQKHNICLRQCRLSPLENFEFSSLYVDLHEIRRYPALRFDPLIQLDRLYLSWCAVDIRSLFSFLVQRGSKEVLVYIEHGWAITSCGNGMLKACPWNVFHNLSQ